MNKKIVISLVVLVLVIWGMTSYFSDQKQETAKIGVMLPLSGAWADFGNNVLSGVNLYAEKNQDCQFVVEDSLGTSEGAIKAYNKLFNIDKIKYFIGPFGPIHTQAVNSSQPEEIKESTFFMAMAACSKEFLDLENSLCIYPGPYHQFKGTLDDFENKIGEISNKSFYTITMNDALGDQVEEFTSIVFDEFEIINVGFDRVNMLDREFYTVTSKIVQENPDFVYIITTSNATNFKITKELKEKNYTGNIIIGSDIDSSQVKENADILEGVYWSGIVKKDFTDEFINAYITKYPDTTADDSLKFYPAIGYASAEAICKTTKEKNNAKISDLIEYINQNSNNLALKNMQYNESRQIEIPIELLLIKDGELISLK